MAAQPVIGPAKSLVVAIQKKTCICIDECSTLPCLDRLEWVVVETIVICRSGSSTNLGPDAVVLFSFKTMTDDGSTTTTMDGDDDTDDDHDS